jgi:hypothetical protein
VNRLLANRAFCAIFPPMTRLLAAIALPLLAGGCYQYVTIGPSSAAPTYDVRLTLTAAGASSLAPTLGRSTTGVEGRILGVTDSAYRLAVSSTLKPDAEDPTSVTRMVWAGESVSIPRITVAGVEQRSLDHRRTAMAIGAATVLGILAAKLIVHGIGSSGGESGDGTSVITP